MSLEKELRMSAVDFVFVWLPVMREVRHTPRCKEFVREIGLVGYWNEFGWPDICRPSGDDDFECD